MQQQPVGVSFDLTPSASATRMSAVILSRRGVVASRTRWSSDLSAVGCPRAANL